MVDIMIAGNGSGKISIGGLPLRAGESGKVSAYTGTWVLDNGVPRISERLRVTFEALFFAQHYAITGIFEGRRGSDIMGLMKSAGATPTPRAQHRAARSRKGNETMHGTYTMKAREILDLKVIDAATGAPMGSVTGILIDGENKRVVAMEIGSGFLSHPGYLPFAGIKSIKNDGLTIQSFDSLLEQAEFESPRLVGSLVGHKVYTEDGQNLGSVEDYDVDTRTGEIASVTIAIDTSLLGTLWRATEKHFAIPGNMIITLADSVVVDNSVPTMIWTGKAA